MFYRPSIPLFFLALTGLCSIAVADLVVLKSGEKLDGKITGGTPTEIIIEVQVSAGITDTVTVLKKDIQSTLTAKPDSTAWEALRNIKPGVNSIPAASYEPLLQSLRSFATQFPSSSYKPEAQKIASELELEKSRVVAGEFKMNGQWLSKDQVQIERYQINAILAFNYMTEQSTSADLMGALNTFDSIEKQFPGARVYPDALDLTRRILATLQADITARLKLLKITTAERNKALSQTAPAQRAELQADLNREQAIANATISAAEKKGQKWPPLIIRSEKSLGLIATKAGEELKRLETFEPAKFRQSLNLIETAKTAFAKKEFVDADNALKEATNLWPANELALRLQPEVTAAKNAPKPVVKEEPIKVGPEKIGNPPQAASPTNKL